jgi:SAM-dependent methyltransferase
MIDRTTLRNTANYLREVRPIDPDELTQYVEGADHPDVVRAALREEAFDLQLREREDGRFEPVDEDPVHRPGWTPTAIPRDVSFVLEDVLVSKFGADWPVGDSGTALRTAIGRLKTDYLYGNNVEYDEVAALGYAIYHLPGYYAAIGYVLDALAENGLLDRTLRVLDVGAGVGGPALGLHDYLPSDAVVSYHAIEPSPAATVLKRLLETTGRNFRLTIHRTTAEAAFGLGKNDPNPSLADPFDLVLFGNVLSELADPVAVCSAGLNVLASDGSVVALAPADKETALLLRDVERAVTASHESAPSVYAPTLRLWPDATPDDQGWSFDVREDLAVPAFQRQLDAAATRAADDEPGEFVNVDVQFAYSILRPDGERRVDVRARADRCARMADAKSHVTNRVNLLAVKLSHNLSDGKNAVYRVGDGSQTVDVYLVCTRETTLNRDLRTAAYGGVVFVENGLFLWNDDEGAYNVVVDDETVVDLVAP